MEQRCEKCHNQPKQSITLNCGHVFCLGCLKVNCPSAALCSKCLNLTTFRDAKPPYEIDPDHCLVCLECKDSVFRMQEFLDGKHRTHEIVSVSKMVSNVQKCLRKHQLTLDLENQALFNQIQSYAHEKRHISEQYSRNLFAMRHSFTELREAIAEKENQISKQYEQMAMKRIQVLDEQIKKIRTDIERCDSYTKSIESHLLSSGIWQPIACTQFMLVYQKVFHSFQEHLAQQRLHQQPQKLFLCDLKLDQINQLVPKVKSITVWSNISKQVQISTAGQDNIEKYFQLKRKELFRSSPDDQQYLEDDRTNLLQSFSTKQNKQHNRTQISLPSFDIESRIQNLRRTLKIGERVGSRPEMNVSQY